MPFVPIADHDPVSAYVASIADPARRAAVAHVYALARELVPTAREGASYGMPCLLHRDVALLAVLDTRRHLAIYPYSGSIVAALGERLSAWSTSAGTIRFQVEHPLPDDLLAQVVRLRRDEIDARSGD